jgi:Holliday junction resolvase
LTNYARGRAFEYRVRKELRSKGYVVIRSASSKGAADLVAIRPYTTAAAEMLGRDIRSHWILFVQCKLSAAAMPPVEWNALCKLAEAALAVPVLAVAGGAGNKKAYYILTALKDGRGGKQPMREFTP